MSSIDISRDALLTLVSRLEREHGQTVVANFALDEQLNRAEAYIRQLLTERDASIEDAKTIRAQLLEAETANEALKTQLCHAATPASIVYRHLNT